MPTSDTPPLGERHLTGDRRLFLHRAGSGPTVVFLPGASAFGLDYLAALELVAESATGVVYDRGGTGWSDPVPLPRSAREVVEELRGLLYEADLSGPYIFVAHSLGGAYARRFAQLHPDEVAGIVALDAFHEDWDDFFPARMALREGSRKAPGVLMRAVTRMVSRRIYRKMFAGLPEAVREPLIARHLTDDALRSAVLERSTLPQLRNELRASRKPDVPVIALTATKVDPGQAMLLPKKTLAELTEGKLRLDAALAASVSRGEHRPLPDAAHSSIAVDRPDAVAAAVRDLL